MNTPNTDNSGMPDSVLKGEQLANDLLMQSVGNQGVPAQPESAPLSPEAPQPQQEPPKPAEPSQFDQLSERFQKLEAKLSDLEAENFTLRQQNSALQQAQAQQPAEQSAQQQDSGFQPLDLDAMNSYGDEITDLAKMVNMLGQQFQNFKQPDQQQPTTEEVISPERAEYSRKLREIIPNFDEINYDQNFISWLGTPNPYVPGQTRHAALVQANERMDLMAIKSIVSEFINSGLYAPAQQNQQQPAAPPAPPAEQPTMETMQPMQPPQAQAQVPGTQPPGQQPMQPNPGPAPVPLAAPPISPTPVGTGNNTLQPTAQQKPTYTRQQVNEFFTRLGRGDFNGHEAWANATQQDILMAPSEGRIQG